MNNQHQSPKEQPEQVEAEEHQANEYEQSAEDQIAEELNEDQLRIVELESALIAAESKLAEQKDSVARAIANADNARKRAEGEVDKARKFALEKFAGELLPVVDNLERALQSGSPDDESVKPILEGVELTHKSFISTIEKFGMQVIDPQGQAFNPELHQAMSIQENAELPPNTVMAVMQKGYVLNERLLRPAMVMVTKAAEGGVDTQA